VVPIDGASLAASLEHYFAQSEQLPTAVRLAASGAAVGGLLVQRMPAEGGSGATPEGASAGADDPQAEVARLAENQRSFAAARAALASLGDEELLLRPAEDLARRCVAGRDVRLYAAQPVSFECRCSPERVAGMLRALGEAEIRDVLAEQGAVTVTCEFCHRPYRFDAVDVEQLFQHGNAPPASPTVN
jgi:molecular chaperone Hsp33